MTNTGSTDLVGRVVVEGEEPLAGVLVSNGLNVVPTDRSGGYRLPARRDCRFVWITVPGGFETDHFYLDGTQQDLRDGEFRLRRVDGVPSSFAFAHITDMHLSTERRCLPEDLADDLARISAGNAIDFVIASGDLTAGGKAEEFAAYQQIVARLGMPVYHAAGNHDDDAECAAENFRDALGPLYYSFDWGPVHFVVYDGEDYARSGASRPDHAEAFPYYPTAQDDWLRADLAAQPPAKPVIVINHFPWGRAFYQQWAGCGIVAVLSGHWHSSRRCDIDGAAHYATPSLCFGGIDQSQRGYRVFRWEAGLQSQTRPLSSGSTGPANASQLPEAPGNDPGPACWPQFQAGPSRRGSQTTGPPPPLARAWRTATGGAIHTASCVVSDGYVYQTTMDDDAGIACGVTALDVATGQLHWRAQSSASIRHAAACWQGRVYAATITGEILCLAADTGADVWQHNLAEPSNRWMYSAPLVSDARVYAGVSSDLVALNADNGQVLWRRDDLGVEDWISSYPSPAAAGDFVAVAFYTQPTALAVLEAATGRTIWQLSGDKAHYMYSTPVLGDGVVFAVSGSAVRAFELATGTPCWQQDIHLGRIQATPALSGTRLFVATGSGCVYALDAGDGRQLWQWQVPTFAPLFTPYARTGPTTLASPVAAAGVVWVAAADGCLYALDEATGKLLWQGQLDAPLAAAPAVGDRALFIGATDGSLSALVATSSTGGT